MVQVSRFQQKSADFSILMGREKSIILADILYAADKDVLFKTIIQETDIICKHFVSIVSIAKVISQRGFKELETKTNEIFTSVKDPFTSIILWAQFFLNHIETSNLDCATSELPDNDKMDKNVKDEISVDLHLKKENHEKKELKDTNCSKNPKHTCFIDIEAFKGDQTCLPENYRQPIMKDLIKSLADLTVKIEVTLSNETRKVEFPNMEIFDILEGTGKIDDVFLYDVGCCKCDECKIIKSPKEKWGEIRILTSGKLVNSEEDIENIKCLMFYDDEETSNIEILKGGKLVMLDKEKDICKFMCVTHNMNLLLKLDTMVDSFVGSWKKAYKQFKAFDSSKDKLIIIVSHPHGCKKHISFGKWEKQYNEKGILKGYKYDTPTCPGCTGSFILMPNFDDPEDINIP